MVASPDAGAANAVLTRVSIPFIAGQWSLLVDQDPDLAAVRLFQSPSLRGSGRFEVGAGLGYWSWLLVSIPFIAGQWSLPDVVFRPAARRAPVSIPFIAGQWSLQSAPARKRRRVSGFQSPSLRGSGRFCSVATGFGLGVQVSIPFIAGQWSLLCNETG